MTSARQLQPNRNFDTTGPGKPIVLLVAHRNHGTPCGPWPAATGSLDKQRRRGPAPLPVRVPGGGRSGTVQSLTVTAAASTRPNMSTVTLDTCSENTDCSTWKNIGMIGMSSSRTSSASLYFAMASALLGA